MKEKELKIVDFTDFPDPASDTFMMMPEDEFEQYETCCDYIQMATLVPPGSKAESEFYCTCETEDGELCDGTVEITQIDIPKQIRWECLKCGDRGAIVNFENTAWDNSFLPDEEKEKFLKMVISDVTAEDSFDDDMYLYDEYDENPFADFEYYVNPYDPDAKRSGGPTSAQIEEMLNSDWMEPDSPIYLNDNIPLPELEKSFYFYNARQFLYLLKREGKFDLTRNGYLKRKTIRKLIENTRWPDNYIENIQAYNKTINETDIWYLYGLRLLLDMSGLITENDKGSQCMLNKDYEHLLSEENAGKLYRLLFSTYFREMNLGFFGSTFELPHLQFSVPYILYKLKTGATSWTSIEDFAEEALLFSVKVEFDMAVFGEFSHKYDMFYEDVLSALERFALVETRKTRKEDADSLFSYPDQIRSTPLLEKFLVFKDLN